MEIILNFMIGIEHPVLEIYKKKGKRRILAFSLNLIKERKYGIFLEWDSLPD